jgi:hypothetical protein
VGAGGAGAVIEIGDDAVFVVMIVRMCVGALVDVRVGVLGTVGMHVAVFMDADQSRTRRMLMAVRMIVSVRVAMHATVLMGMGVFVPIALNAGFARATTANCAHSP